MATLYVRNFPDTLYKTIQELAGDDKRSIGAEVIDLVNNAVARLLRKRRRRAAMERIEGRYNHFHPSHDGKDTLALLREDRDR